jgi:hypothetical protein
VNRLVDGVTAQDVVDALRFALPTQGDDPAQRLEIVDALLARAPEGRTDRGLALLMDMIASGSITVALR